MDSYLVGFISIAITTLVSVLGMLVVRHKVGIENLSTYHEVAGNLLSIIGTLYAVLLGFIVVDAMNHLQETRTTVEQEANALANVFFAADGIEVQRKARIQELCRKYAELVINEEWPEMRQRRASHAAYVCCWKTWKNVTHMEPSNQREDNLQQTMLSELCVMAQSRRSRILASVHGIAPIMWAVLITGGVFTVLFTYFFGVKNVKAQILMTVLVSITLSLNVFLVYLFGSPFSGDMAVPPDAFRLDLKVFDGYEKQTQEISNTLIFKEIGETDLNPSQDGISPNWGSGR